MQLRIVGVDSTWGGSTRFQDGFVEQWFCSFFVVEDVVSDLWWLDWSSDERNGHTEWAPADNPNIVTSFLSPPNSSIFSWIHWRRKTWSCRPRLSSPCSWVTNEGKKPSAPILVKWASSRLNEKGFSALPVIKAHADEGLFRQCNHGGCVVYLSCWSQLFSSTWSTNI